MAVGPPDVRPSGAGLPRGTAVWVLAGDTWRQSWREVVVRTELVALLFLSLIAGVAAVGSPTAGAGAIQMLAICLMLVPFAVVLAAGQVWRSPEAEVAVFARPVTAAGYVLGRTLGLVAVGAAMLLAVNVLGSLALFGIARLPLGSSIAWNTAWSVLAVGPSLVLTASAAVWLVGRTGGGARYFTLGILGSLVVAFVEYKWTALAAALDPHLVLWSPFPGLLTLGLALPPELLGPTPGWLWANRAVWLVVAVILLLAAIRERDRGRATPSASPSRDRQLYRSAVVALGMVMVWLEAGALSLSPGVLPTGAAATAARSTGLRAAGPLALSVAVNQASGVVDGTATVHVVTTARSSQLLWFWLNRGLVVQRATWNGQSAAIAHAGGRVLAGTAARLVAVRVPGGSGTLGLTYAGRLLPLATWLPTPPFGPGSNAATAYAGGGRVFWSGAGAWYPRLLAARGAGAPIFTPTSLSWHLTGTGPRVSAWSGLPRPNATGMLPSVLWLQGPYHQTVVDGVSVYTRRGVGPVQQASLSAYAAALKVLGRWLPGETGTVPVMVVDPLLTHPAMTPAFVALPGNQPYCIPADPVVGACTTSEPTSPAPWLRLAALGWENALGLAPGGSRVTTPAWPAGDQREQLVGVLAAATVMRADAGGPVARAVALAGYQRRSTLPVVGRLSAARAAELKQLAGWAASASASQWAGMVARVVGTAAHGALSWSNVAAAESS
ncbi:MAG: hypothetical protein M0Z54_15250 [Thermaerobacter sp.]|nr:hypothetical protein [Thermaerobacter sp.]